MLIRMKKTGDGVVMTCLREGQSPQIQRTAHDGFFALHDLLHYAVETTLGFDEAFLGLIAAGWSFENFTRRDDPRYRPLPGQALAAEHIVNIFSLALREAVPQDQELLELLTEEINRDLAAAMRDCGIVVPKLTARDIATITRTFGELSRRWAALSVGGELELTFPKPQTPAGSVRSAATRPSGAD
jgi:hypothetical protein